jgi:predicted acylesterase/phospholipase RssA
VLIPHNRFVCAVGTSDVTHPAGPTLFRTYDVRRNKEYNCTIWEAGRATAAAPTFFKPITIGPAGSPTNYVDAGLGCNNPVKQVLAEAAREFGDDARVGCLSSIGTGQANSANFGKPGCCQRMVPLDLIRVLEKIATNSGSTAEEMAQKYRNSDIYHRLDVDRGLDSVFLDEWKRLGDVRARTKNYLRLDHVSRHVDRVVDALSRPYNAPTHQLSSLGTS